MPEIIPHTMGDRITYCRSSLCLTRKELCKLWGGASIPTLSRWELDIIEIPSKKLSSLADFFNNHGLMMTEQWIKEAVGTPPFLLPHNKFDTPDFDSLAQEKLLDINRQIPNFIFGQVSNNLMSPFMKYGDYVGGVSLSQDVEKNALIGKMIFLKKKRMGIAVGILQKLEDEIAIAGLDKRTESLPNEKIERIGEIEWIIRRP